ANYYVGNDAAQWHTGAPTYARVEYQSVYAGVDLVYYGNQQNQLEYDFVVAPGADAGVIGLAYAGADRLELDHGDLVLHVGNDQIRQHRPFTYQEVNGARHEVASQYVLTGATQVGIQLGAYDHSRPLVIDPFISFSSYLGGSGFDKAQNIAVDPFS